MLLSPPSSKRSDTRFAYTTLFRSLDDNGIGFGQPDAEFVDRHRLDVLAVGRDHRHFQARNAHVEDRLRRAVDETQPKLLAGFEDTAIGRASCRERVCTEV